MNTILADALRGTLQDLDEAIRNSRTCIRKGDARKAEFLSEYLRLIGRAHDLKDARQAESNIVLAICDPHLPMPFAEQVVGENKFRREWNMAHRAVPSAEKPTPALLRNKIAA